MDITKIKGVIFDVDGVLLASMSIWTDLGARYLKSLGRTPEEGLAEILFSMSMEQGAEYLNERYGLGREQSEIMEGLENMLRDFSAARARTSAFSSSAMCFAVRSSCTTNTWKKQLLMRQPSAVNGVSGQTT